MKKSKPEKLEQPKKLEFIGKIISVQPRIRLYRSFDESSHNYLGYAIKMEGLLTDFGNVAHPDEFEHNNELYEYFEGWEDFYIQIYEEMFAYLHLLKDDSEYRYPFIDEEPTGPEDEPEKVTFTIGIGKTAQAKFNFKVNDIISGECLPVQDPRMEPVDLYKVSKLKMLLKGEQGRTSEPWETVAPELETYRERGYRRLSARTYDSNCSSCIWAAREPVVITIDHWNPGPKKYRYETFCYGPLNCKLYKAGPVRKVPGRKGQSWTEDDWVYEEMTSHREHELDDLD